MAQLQHWYKGEDINTLRAISVKDVPVDTPIDFVEQNFQSIKVLGRVKVHGRMYYPQSLLVLCKCRGRVNTKAISLNVLPEGSDSAWRIVGSSEGGNASNNDPIGDPAPETQQVTGLAFQLQASMPEAIIRAVGDIMQRTSKPTSDSNLYRRLRTFSGVTPMPP